MKGSFVKRSKDSKTVNAGFRSARPLSARELVADQARTERLRPLSARGGDGSSAFCVVGMSKEAEEMKFAVSDLGKKKLVRPTSAYMYRKNDTLERNDPRNGPDGGHHEPGTSLQDYTIIAKLGQGGSANVFLAKFCHDQSSRVLKRIVLGSKSPSPSSERFSAIAKAERDNVMREIKLMSRLQSSHFIHYYTSFMQQQQGKHPSIFIVMEHAEKGSVSSIIADVKSRGLFFDEQIIWKCLLQVGSGLCSLHDMRIIHRDIKPANILVTADDHFKIADLGIAVDTSLANVQGRMRTGRCGTIAYMAPEVSNDSPYDARADVWSLGCLLFELALLSPPFPAGTQIDTITRVENGISLDEIETRAATLHLPHRYSDKLNNHVMWCFAVNPSNRPTSRDLIMTSDCLAKSLELRVALPDSSRRVYLPCDPQNPRSSRPASAPLSRGKQRFPSSSPLLAKFPRLPPAPAPVHIEASSPDNLSEISNISPIRVADGEAARHFKEEEEPDLENFKTEEADHIDKRGSQSGRQNLVQVTEISVHVRNDLNIITHENKVSNVGAESDVPLRMTEKAMIENERRLIQTLKKILEKAEARGKRTTLNALESIYLSQVGIPLTKSLKGISKLDQAESLRTFISKQSQHFILGDDDSVRLRSSVPIRSGESRAAASSRILSSMLK
uniref:non-specific serine/threonine protein kinase n=1 Tax=Hanusia phi TaxID=3032 RepID=A0A7S0HRN3_9CRYP|mmetsp:Transcript_33017/g.74132  ORF Transcript_33017/g.74132 Transcript_33017/m.74132 type:complete len:673 (+) Transcript_33017:199-2217(+)